MGPMTLGSDFANWLSIGGKGVISVVSNLLPQAVAALCNNCLINNWLAAREIHMRLYGLASGLLRLDTNPVPVKTAMRLLGLDSGAVRLPLCAPGEAVVRQIAALLEEQGLKASEEEEAAAPAVTVTAGAKAGDPARA